MKDSTNNINDGFYGFVIGLIVSGIVAYGYRDSFLQSQSKNLRLEEKLETCTSRLDAFKDGVNAGGR